MEENKQNKKGLIMAITIISIISIGNIYLIKNIVANTLYIVLKMPLLLIFFLHI